MSETSPANLSSFPSRFAEPQGQKRIGSGVFSSAPYAGAGGNEVGFFLVLSARSVVGPEALRAPRIVAAGCKAPEHR
jgi:hypothetical protein